MSARVVELHTSAGVLQVELYDDEVDVVCAAESFWRLALTQQLTGDLFRRLVPGFVLVGDVAGPASVADDTATLPRCYGRVALPRDTVACRSPRLRHVGAGLVSCPVVAGVVPAQAFVITLSPAPALDGVYVVFGRIRSGMRVLQQVAAMQTDESFCLRTPLRVRDCRALHLPRHVAPSVTAMHDSDDKQSTAALRASCVLPRTLHGASVVSSLLSDV